jgi:hypothetical protein
MDMLKQARKRLKWLFRSRRKEREEERLLQAFLENGSPASCLVLCQRESGSWEIPEPDPERIRAITKIVAEAIRDEDLPEPRTSIEDLIERGSGVGETPFFTPPDSGRG